MYAQKTTTCHGKKLKKNYTNEKTYIHESESLKYS